MVARDTDDTQPLEVEAFGDIGGFDLAMPIEEEQEAESPMDEAFNTAGAESADAENAKPKQQVPSCEQNIVQLPWDHLT